jgi:hypothetical protein
MATTTATTIRTARFWEWVNGGWVKLTVRPGRRLLHIGGGRTDEGFQTVMNRWDVDEDGVTHEFAENGRDCDGYYSRGAEYFADRSQLRGVTITEPTDPDVTHLPAWVTMDRHQRDHAAEAAGY